MRRNDEDHELQELHRSVAMAAEETEAGPLTSTTNEGILQRRVSLADDGEDAAISSEDAYTTRLDRRTRLKLDFILLPFLALLFLLNSLDKSNIGNAETAGFTKDAGLSASDLNLSLAFFFAFFVALQPVGAALGRQFGMARWVPACMSLWGVCTLLHIFVRRRWQLVCLRVAIASLEAGFYPTTVSYLSLFYTRYEFAVRLGLFYGQTAVAGALGGVLSWAVFSRFPAQPAGPQLPPMAEVTDREGWKSWEVLFLIEGCTTIIVALVGFVWLPHSADTAWFFNAQERMWAEQRIKVDRESTVGATKQSASRHTFEEGEDRDVDDADEGDEVHQRLLYTQTSGGSPLRRKLSTMSTRSMTADSGLSRHDILTAIFNTKIWHLLICNILSAIPATAFGVFLPLVIKQLSPSLNLSPAESNLLSAPPFAIGAVVLFLFTVWSDRSRQRLAPILVGLGLLLVGLTLTVMAPPAGYILRYAALCVLLSGSFIASPLTVAWLADNTPEPGKRAILLGINGWGNLAGVFSALLFTPADRASGYVRPFIVTLVCVLASFVGFIAFWVVLIRENKWREEVCAGWTDEEREREDLTGTAPLPRGFWSTLGVEGMLRWLGMDDGRKGDEKLTFRYGL